MKVLKNISQDNELLSKVFPVSQSLQIDPYNKTFEHVYAMLFQHGNISKMGRMVCCLASGISSYKVQAGVIHMLYELILKLFVGNLSY